MNFTDFIRDFKEFDFTVERDGEVLNISILNGKITAKLQSCEIVEVVVNHDIDGKNGVVWAHIPTISQDLHTSLSRSSTILLAKQVLGSSEIDLGLLRDVELELDEDTLSKVDELANKHGVSREDILVLILCTISEHGATE